MIRSGFAPGSDPGSRRQKAKNWLDRVGLLALAYAVRQAALSVRPAVILGNIRTRRTAEAGAAFPPLKLIYLVAGHFDREGFTRTGRDNFDDVVNALRLSGADPAIGPHRILDFGCGCGRVLRYWQSLPTVEAHGVDPNPALAGWCREHLPGATVTDSPNEPPLAVADDFYDAVYCISVFTHLTVAAQRGWVDELQRVLKPGGHLVVTTHGAVTAQRLATDLRRTFADVGVVVLHEQRQGSNLCATYHSESYMRTQFAPALETVAFIPLGLRWGTHDITVYRKSSERDGT